MKIFFLIALTLGINSTQSLAVTMPDEFNPWLKDAEVGATGSIDEGETVFLEAMKYGVMMQKTSTSSQDRDELRKQFDSKMLEAFSKGNIKAQLVADAGIKEAFGMVDKSKDAKLIYEVGKLMQLGFLLCRNVTVENGITTVERRCRANAYTWELADELRKKREERYFGFFLKAANLGYPPAQYEIGYLMMRKSEDFPSNAMELDGMRGTQATDWLSKAAEGGNAEAGMLLADIQKEKQKELDEKAREAAAENEHENTKPKCTNIRFTGVAAAAYFSEYIEQVLASRDIEDTLARNPIQCQGLNMFGDLHCTGLAYFKNHKGRIVDWNRKFYFIDSPVDFNSGRKNMKLAIRRKDAVCLK